MNFSNQQLYNFNGEILDLSKIEELLTQLGQNHLIDEFSNEVKLDDLSTHLVFEMNSAIKRNKLSPSLPYLSFNGFFDHDLFIVIVLCGLFETKKINQVG